MRGVGGRWTAQVRRRRGVGVARVFVGIDPLFAGAEQSGSTAAFVGIGGTGGSGHRVGAGIFLGRGIERAAKVANLILSANAFFAAYRHVFNADDLVADEANELDVVGRRAVDPLFVILTILGFSQTLRRTADGEDHHILVHADEGVVVFDGGGEHGWETFLDGLSLGGRLEVEYRGEEIFDLVGGDGGIVLEDEQDVGAG